ncbi:MAG: tetratricopeptide repeat protein [Planctomycetota bacterium]
MALYADAANFQTNGAPELAVEAWRSLITRHPDSKLASKAAHYLGVCYMQIDTPDWPNAAAAFELALQDRQFELREESLSNQGWCLFASAEMAPGDQSGKLRKAIATFGRLLNEHPESKYRDRAQFYSGEAAYALGDLARAVQFYDALLRSSDASKSSLRCDALYARGVAQQELSKPSSAASSYRQWLDACSDPDLESDVRLRLGDVKLSLDRYEEAIEQFDRVISSATAITADQAYATFRKGFALARSNRAQAATDTYERLLSRFPESDFIVASTLASAQMSYRAGDMSLSQKRFQQLLDWQGSEQVNSETATEASHWLARIELNKADEAGDPAEPARVALAIATDQLQRSPAGAYVMMLRMDAAEAMSLIPDQRPEALDAFESVAQDASDTTIAARALYNAAFIALQLKQLEKAVMLARRFATDFDDDDFAVDAQFISAEANRQLGQARRAADEFRTLLDLPTSQDHPQRSAWLRRAMNAFNAAGRYADTRRLITEEFDSLTSPSERAEALMLAGQAELDAGLPAKAAERFLQSRDSNPSWSRASEVSLRAADALQSVGKVSDAKSIWEELIRSEGASSIGNQARYKLAQLASSEDNFARAIELHVAVLQTDAGGQLEPFSRFGKGYAEIQLERFADAIETLTPLIDAPAGHELKDDALLTRGIAHRNVNELSAAADDLVEFLNTSPQGTNLGHALYELALIDQRRSQPDNAVKRLRRLTTEVPDYPGMDRVIYELAWSLRESGRDDEAIAEFTRLIDDYPDNEFVGEAAYSVGEHHYQMAQWSPAANAFRVAAEKAIDDDLKEKAIYRLGWSHYKSERYVEAERAFQRQLNETPEGMLSLDAMMMVGETRFEREQFESAWSVYEEAREKIQTSGDNAQSIRDPIQRQVRELILLHGGQSLSQLSRFDEALQWFDELRNRFPATGYLPQVFYESGFAYQQSGKSDQALKLYAQVADNYRTEIASRARFMMGEIHFDDKAFDQAITEFQRVMYGFGAEQAPPPIRNWQAKSGFEAGRCAELLIQVAKTDAKKAKATEYARRFYKFVTDRHADHELAGQASNRLAQLPPL